MDTSLLTTKIETAKRDVGEAEEEIEKLIRELLVLTRAEKTTISAALEGAFKKLRAARLDLEELETFLAQSGEQK